MRSLCSLALAAGLVVALVPGCGKSGGFASAAPSPGLYRLDDGATFLELRKEGTFTVHRRSPASIGATECGAWRRDNLAPTGHVVMHDGFYWPTPSRFPSTVFHKITLRGEESGDLVVVGESEWAGSFTQRWQQGAKVVLPPCTVPTR